jgi:hypothetical protein
MVALTRRPPWPAPILIDLAAGRDPTDTAVTPDVVAMALDHRMGGLLLTWAQDRPLDPTLRARLALHDLRVQAHVARVQSLLEDCVSRLAESGIDVASLKGPPAESRWYLRRGERPTSDVDLWLCPTQLDRAGDAVRLLQPDHPWVGFVGDLAQAGSLQNVTLRVGAIEVDLHFDLLKTGVATRQSTRIWRATEPFELPGGTVVRVLDETAALLHLLVHLNKDRFQRLLGYADVVRVMRRDVDWPRLLRLAEAEGLAVPVMCSLEAVTSDLRVPWPEGLPPAAGPRRVAWDALWGRRVRLWGSEGRRRFRHRQLALVPMSSRGAQETWRALSHAAVPPAQVLQCRSPAAPRTRVARSLDRVRT